MKNDKSKETAEETTGEPVFTQIDPADSKALAEAIVAVLASKKANDIKMIYVEKQTVIADYFVIATGNSTTQLHAMCDELEERLSACGCPALHVEGRSSDTWVLADFGTVSVHLFSRTARDFYKLEKLWQDAENIDITKFLN